MANNRMYLCCTVCCEDPEKTFDDCLFFLAKYYPREGWYARVDTSLDERIDAWFVKHIHGTLFGDYIRVLTEQQMVDLDEFIRDKRDIVQRLSKVVGAEGFDHREEP